MTSPALYRWRKLKLKRSLRKRQTPAERILWHALRNRKCHGLKWRRQANIGIFIVDFLCSQHRLVIEVDGGIHRFQREYDEARTRILHLFGYRVIRFRNEEVLRNIPKVLRRILRAVTTDTPSTSAIPSATARPVPRRAFCPSEERHS